MYSQCFLIGLSYMNTHNLLLYLPGFVHDQTPKVENKNLQQRTLLGFNHFEQAFLVVTLAEREIFKKAEF